VVRIILDIKEREGDFYDTLVKDNVGRNL